jgi:hypothetical protein
MTSLHVVASGGSADAPGYAVVRFPHKVVTYSRASPTSRVRKTWSLPPHLATRKDKEND